jgi:sulfatase maturation enzyme AslB (radical SAM superfamily)
MTFETAQKVVDWIFTHVPDYADKVEIDFIGGEPLLEFTLIKEIFSYVYKIRPEIPYIFFATTNGTLLTAELKQWFIEHLDCFQLALSLDGRKETHDKNRSNSFDSIDVDFFLQNYPEQGVKMTVSEYSLPNLADNIVYLHSLGIKEIEGVNLAEGNFDWNKDEYIKLLIPQLKMLVDYYVEHDDLIPCMLFDKEINICETGNKERKKWCGIGTGTPFFDIDGKKYPCSFITPMTFTENELNAIMQTDFSDNEKFIDDDCFSNCYIYPICPTCSGANYLINKSFKTRIKSKCRIQKLVSLFIADLQAKRLIKNNGYINDEKDNTKLYYTIEAIKKIKALYLEEYVKFGI